jgi:hypothetical protein
MCLAVCWADPHEIASAGLLGDDGVVLGKLDRNYLRHDGAEHVLCFAPTRRRRASVWWCRLLTGPAPRSFMISRGELGADRGFARALRPRVAV